MKKYLSTDVNTATDQRISFLFDEFEKICVSFSGGKDSTVLLHKVLCEAVKRDRTVDVLFIDWEAQYQATINHVAEMMQHPNVNPFWICLPITTCNESSVYQQNWTAWHPDEKDRWVRPLPEHAITDPAYFPFYTFGMTFEEFIPAWNKWYAKNDPAAFLIGIRADESLNRFRSVKKSERRKNYKGLQWSTQETAQGFSFYPLYDWHVEDIWAFLGNSSLPYNTIYDRMYLSGMSLHEMRICEPYSKEARSNLDKYHLLEPDTWNKIVSRVEGANFGAKYGNSNLLKIHKPSELTWQEYAQYLLDTLPKDAKKHFSKHIHPEKHENKVEFWKLVCKTLIENDYLCTQLKPSKNRDSIDKRSALKEKYSAL